MAKANLDTVAIYARRSTDEHQAESLDTQIDQAKRYCEEKGWAVGPVFRDDAVSRAEFKKRPGLIRMLNGAKDGEFSRVVTRDETRLGGDINRVGLVIQDLTDAGVQLVYYYADETVSMETAVDKFLVAARNFASELEREKISQRTHEHLLRKARAGRPAGGISYGYRIVADPEKRYVIEPVEAEVVRRIFAAYAVGEGQRGIASKLNEDGVRSPRQGKRGTGSWASSAIRAILTNPRYVGAGRYNQTQKLYRSGTKVREERPAAEHVTYETPAIIERELWEAVVARFEENKPFGEARSTRGARRRYLLSGLTRCGACGGPMTVANSRRSKVNGKAYTCGWHRDRGDTICASGARQSVAEVDAAVIGFVRDRILVEEVVTKICQQLRGVLKERLAGAPERTESLQVQADKLKMQISRMVRALAASDDPPSAIVRAIADAEKKLRHVEVELVAAESTFGALDLEIRRVEQEAKERMADLAAEFEANPERARVVMESLVSASLTATVVQGPGRTRFRVEGPLAVSGLLMSVLAQENKTPGGLSGGSDCVASPAGFEPASPT